MTYIQTDFPITAICLAEAGNELFTGGIDNDIKVWDLRKQAVTYTLLGHTDTVTSLQMSPDNQTLLSNAHDSTVRTWDVRPFAPADRRIQTYDGAPTGQERNLLKASWDSTGEKIAAGSGDQSVAIWEARTGKLLNKLPGHRGTVNDVRFHPRGEPICKCLETPPALLFSRVLQCVRSIATNSDTSTHPPNIVLQNTLRCGECEFGVLPLRTSKLLKTLTRLFHTFHSTCRIT